ncbi:MAG: type III-B CRISPR-associated protein Cas10/Cmr2 [Verrucomicrobia bacterium]|nr:type III-B CRISPR-associated protein Cas10/Cmr2 [Verrucomicrobiota bacterium]
MNYWQRKLLAFLHDPPSKALDIAQHKENAQVLLRQAGFSDDEIKSSNSIADQTASAADRFPFPHYSAGSLRCHFDGVRNMFLHPLGSKIGERLDKSAVFKFNREFESAALAIETDQAIQPVVECPPDWSNDQQWRARFFAHWRLFRKHASEHDERFAFLPADTRIPDHTVWTHMQIVSALASCVEADNKHAKLSPAFIKFQIGPVQDFIAQARSTRDQWSGSYLLSWLMAAGLKKLSELVGPDAVIYPSLSGQPLFDLHWRDELWNQVKIGDKSVWDSIQHRPNDLLTPNLPNVFLAVLPSADAEATAKSVETAIREEFNKIADATWDACRDADLTTDESAISESDRRERFLRQTQRFLSISWRTTPWPKNIDDVFKAVEKIEFSQGHDQLDLKKRVEHFINAAQELIPSDHRDQRYYEDKDTKTKLNNVGIAWALIYSLNSWELDAVRQTRAFDAWNPGGWDIGASNNKDSLNGKDEAVAGGRIWLERCKNIIEASKNSDNPENSDTPQNTESTNQTAPLAHRFKHDDWLGAVTLIKRVWDVAYLRPQWGLARLKMPNTHGLAKHEPFSNDDDQNAASHDDDEKYFAVIAFDGDQIGRWVSGDNCPIFSQQLADYTDGSGNPKGAIEYFRRESNPDSLGQGTLQQRFKELLNTARPLSPSYHLQFSEALTNFALKAARPIVEAFDGRLIYSGGDDVIALLPADTAIPCAQALNMTFQGDQELPEFLKNHAEKLSDQKKRSCSNRYQKLAAENKLFGINAPGFICRKDESIDSDSVRCIPFLVPGENATASAGIAIAHFKTPLQDVIHAAKNAEKHAKSELGRNALAVTLMKRSGEINKWGCDWNSKGPELYYKTVELLQNNKLSSRFPHRIAGLLSQYIENPTPLIAELNEKSRSQGSETTAASTGFDVTETALRELAAVLDRQRSPGIKLETLREKFDPLVREYLDSIKPNDTQNTQKSPTDRKLDLLVGLFKTVAFTNRTNLNHKPENHVHEQNNS